MTDALESVRRLRRIASKLVELGDDDGRWFSAALQEYEAGARHGRGLEDAFGITAGQGKTAWWEIEAIERRAALLREIRARHFPRMSARAAARQISAQTARYEAGRWRLHRGYVTPPAGTGALTADFFALLRLGPAPGYSTVRAALANQRPSPVGHDMQFNAA